MLGTVVVCVDVSKEVTVVVVTTGDESVEVLVLYTEWQLLDVCQSQVLLLLSLVYEDGLVEALLVVVLLVP